LGTRAEASCAWARSAARARTADAGASYGDSAAVEVHADQKWIYLREDALLPLVEQFFDQRIFGPMRLDKLARQLKAQGHEQKRSGKHLATRLRHQMAEADRKIKIQIQALEDGIEPEVVTARIAEVKADKEAAATDLAELAPDDKEAEEADLRDRLARIPDLGRSLRDAAPDVKRQTFEAFGLQIQFDKAQRGIEISATIAEGVAEAFENTKALQTEGLQVTISDSGGGIRTDIRDARFSLQREPQLGLNSPALPLENRGVPGKSPGLTRASSGAHRTGMVSTDAPRSPSRVVGREFTA